MNGLGVFVLWLDRVMCRALDVFTVSTAGILLVFVELRSFLALRFEQFSVMG